MKMLEKFKQNQYENIYFPHQEGDRPKTLFFPKNFNAG
jgi:hypothetical protein